MFCPEIITYYLSLSTYLITYHSSLITHNPSLHQTVTCETKVPFVYSHQCRNVIFTYISPLIIITGLLSSFVLPLGSMILIRSKSKFFDAYFLEWFERRIEDVNELKPDVMFMFKFFAENACQFTQLLVFGIG